MAIKIWISISNKNYTLIKWLEMNLWHSKILYDYDIIISIIVIIAIIIITNISHWYIYHYYQCYFYYTSNITNEIYKFGPKKNLIDLKHKNVCRTNIIPLIYFSLIYLRWKKEIKVQISWKLHIMAVKDISDQINQLAIRSTQLTHKLLNKI